MSARTDVEAAARARAEALVTGDVHQLRALLHPDFHWTSHRGDRFDREAYLRANTGAGLRWQGQELSNVEVVVVGEAAVLTATVIDRVERDGVSDTFRMPMTQVWVRDPRGAWVCLAGHAGPRGG